MSFIEAQEASEYDQISSKILTSSTKIIFILICVYLAAPIWAFVPLCTLYFWHFKTLTNFGASANNENYSQNLKKFWTAFRVAVCLSIVADSFVWLRVDALPLMITAATWPFFIHELKSFLSPTHKYARYFYAADECLCKVAIIINPLAQYKYEVGVSLIFQCAAVLTIIGDLGRLHHIRVLKETVILTCFDLLDKIKAAPFVPGRWRHFYDRTFGIVATEYRTVCEYMTAWRRQSRYNNTQVAALVAQSLEPAYQITAESLYLGSKRGGQAKNEAVSPHAIRQRLDDLCRNILADSTENVTLFLEELSKESPSYREELIILHQRGEIQRISDLLTWLYGQKNAHRNIGQYLQSHEISQELEWMILRLHRNIEHIASVGANPALQPGADITPQDSEQIPAGIFNILGKILETQRQAVTNPTSQRTAAIRAQMRLLARLMDKVYRCQGAILGLISDETLTQGDPLDSAWSALINRETQAAYRRQKRAFFLDNNIDTLLDDESFSHKIARAESLFIDPNNIEHQYLLSLMHFPGRGPSDKYENFSDMTFSRHFCYTELFPFQQSSSVFQSTFFPRIFSQQTVQELIATTQYLYLMAKSEESSAPWVARWEHEWESYINEAYPLEPGVQLPLPAENQYALLQAYQYTHNQKQMSVSQRLVFENNADIFKPQDYINSWTERQKREYFHQNKLMVTGYELAGELLLQQIENGSAESAEELRQVFVSREFATVILFNKGLLEVADMAGCLRAGVVYRPPCQHHIAQIGVIPQLMGTTPARAHFFGL